uniref:MICOS complex subunit MIC10-like n=1 Tax=Myxine glutinosa TaxID=7769 RepID=UPI00358EE2D5
MSEKELGKRWDRCTADGILKFGGGALIGGAISLLFLKRRTWPVVFGAGLGLGLAMSHCQQHLPLQAPSTAVTPH